MCWFEEGVGDKGSCVGRIMSVVVDVAVVVVGRLAAYFRGSAERAIWHRWVDGDGATCNERGKEKK